MNSDRRDFLKTFVLGAISTGPLLSLLSCDTSDVKQKNTDIRPENDYSQGIELRKGYIVMEPEVQRNMEALAVAMVPGVRQINIRKILMDKFSQDHGDAGFFDAGLWNINTISKMQSKKPFYELEDPEEIDTVLKIVRKTNYSFFSRFRRTIISTYYSHPVSWKKLKYSGPPQPVGFMDYDKPPKHS